MKFKVDDVVECIDPGAYKFTVGSKYRILKAYTDTGDDFVHVIDNADNKTSCFAARFKFPAEDMMEVGDEIENVSDYDYDIPAGYRAIVTNVSRRCVYFKSTTGSERHRLKERYQIVRKHNQTSSQTAKPKGETKMSIPKVITDSYKETKDAVLVDKFFSGKVGHGNPYEDLLFMLHKTEILKEAMHLQREEDDAKK